MTFPIPPSSPMIISDALNSVQSITLQYLQYAFGKVNTYSSSWFNNVSTPLKREQQSVKKDRKEMILTGSDGLV